MTDAEKMREAAADWCADEADNCDDAAKWGGHRKYVQDCKAAAYALRNAASKIRAIPVDASAPAADCQQAGLVTAGEVEVCGICDIPGCYHIRERQAYVRQCTDQNTIKNLPRGLLDEVMRLLDTYERRSEHAYLCPIRQGNQCDCGINELRSETGDLLDKMRAARPSAGLLDEVKAALRVAGDALADSQWSGGSAERRVSDALARLEREVG